MPASPLDLPSLLSPLDGDAPSGPDLVYDEAFLALEQAAAGKAETQWSAAVPADWNEVHERALALAARTRDLRVGVWLARAHTRLMGLAGLAEGLALLQGLVENHWATVHPALDPADGNDPTMRMNTLAALAAHDGGLADLRAMALAPVRGSLSLRDLELGLGRAEASAGETQPTEAGVLLALQTLAGEHAELAGQAAAARQSARALDAALQAHDSSRAPDLSAVLRQLDMLADALARALGPATEDAQAGDPGTAQPTPAAAATGAIGSRADAARAIGRICEWLERNEPSHPAPLLLRRAQRLMDKSFLDIVRDLAPDALQQVEHLAGPQA